MKRMFDVLVAGALLAVAFVPIVVIAVLVKLTSPGPVLYWSERVGRYNRCFRMPKFRTMRVGTPQVASHVLAQADAWVTPVGCLLRRTSLDELPQLWSILKGDMSLVGPRPALYNQHDLIAIRTEMGIDTLLPGLTGWAQVNGRDETPIPRKVALDKYYFDHRTLWFDLKIIVLTGWKVLRREGTAVPPDVQASDSPRAMAVSLLRSGNTFLAKGEYGRAVADYEQATQLDPSLAIAHIACGLAWTAKGEYARAVAERDEAIRRQPSLASTFRNIGGLPLGSEIEPALIQGDLTVAELFPDLSSDDERFIVDTVRELFSRQSHSGTPQQPR